MDRQRELDQIQRCLNSDNGKVLMRELEDFLDPMETARIGETQTDIIIRAARRDVYKTLLMLQAGEFK